VLQLGFVCLLILELHWLTSLQNKALLADIQSHAASQKQWLGRGEEQIIMLQLKKKDHLEKLRENRCKIFPVLPRTSVNIPPWGMGAC